MMLVSLFSVVAMVLMLPSCAQESSSAWRTISVSIHCTSNPEQWQPSRQEEGVASGSSGLEPIIPCIELTEALGSMESGTKLELDPGQHFLRETKMLLGLDSVSITGNESSLTCERHTGLGFVNISGLTISNVIIEECGMRHATIATPNLLRGYAVPPSLKVAVLVVGCAEVVFQGVTINATDGLGLLAANPIGNCTLHRVNFTSNRPLSCEGSADDTNAGEEATEEGVGGGALFIYQDELYSDDAEAAIRNTTVRSQCMLTISSSHFQHNAGCANPPMASSRTILTQRLGGGGGLSVLLTQQSYRVDVVVESTMFYGNDAVEGGGAYMGLSSGSDRSTVSFVGCGFISNGLASVSEESGIMRSVCSDGAGLAIRNEMFDYTRGRCLEDERTANMHENRPSVRISGTRFYNNIALHHGGGIMMELSHQPIGVLNGHHYLYHWVLESCNFTHNKARHGSAGYLKKTATLGDEDTMLLVLKEVSVTDNRLVSSHRQSDVTALSSSALEIENLMVDIEHRLLCEDNLVTSLYLKSTQVTVVGGARVDIKCNIGFLGGGISIEGDISMIRLQNDTLITLQDNVATLKGGAIYVASSRIYEQQIQANRLSYSNCFIQLPMVGSSDHEGTLFDLSGQLAKVKFINNNSPSGGQIFGSTLEACPWTKQLAKQPGGDLSVYQALHRTSGFLEFDEYPNSTRSVSTLAVRISAFAGNESSPSLELHPGQRIEIRILIYDDFDQLETYSVVHSVVLGKPLVTIRLGETVAGLVDKNVYPRLQVTGAENQTINITLIEVLSQVSTNLTVNILPCSIGFVFHVGKQVCKCDSKLEENGIECDEELQRLLVPPSTWVGPFSVTDDHTTADLVVSKCPLRFCKEQSVSITPPYYDNLCAEGSRHGGVACGACLPNYSALLGQYNKCACCDNKWLMLVPIFGIAGVILFLCIAFFQLTVDKGWMYIVIFYCNTVILYAYFIPNSKQLNGILLPASLLSLQVGYEVCLYDGMTTLQHVALQLAFPVYLYLLMFLFALLSKRSSWLSRRFSPTQTFLTLSVMSYTSVLQTCVSAMFAIRLSTLSSGNTTVSSLRWQTDPSVSYFTGWHAVLVICCATLLLVYIIPFPFLMLFPGPIYRYIKHLKPFLDAMWAPYKVKFRFWLGVRMLTIIVVYLMSCIKTYSTTGVFVFSVVLLLFLQCQSSIGPFRSKWMNIVDRALMTTIILLLVHAFYSSTSSLKLPKTVHTVYIATCMGVAYILIAVALVFNLALRFPAIQKCSAKHCLLTCFKRTKAGIRRKKRSISIDTREDVSTNAVYHTATSLAMNLSHRIRRTSFNHLRDSILESDIL